MYTQKIQEPAPENTNHPRSHSRAIMALDYSRLRLENSRMENKSGPVFCVRQVYFTKSCQQIWGSVNQPFIYFLYITSEVKEYTMRHCIYHTDLGQNAVFHNFSKQIAPSQYSGRSILGFLMAKPFKKFPKSPIRPAGSHF